MQIYRPLTTIRALTFDLDDTLYDNRQVIEKTLTETHAALQQSHPELAAYSYQAYEDLSAAVRTQYPQLYHDPTAWRLHVLQQILRSVGLSPAQAEQRANTIMTVFHHWRNQIIVTDETHAILAALAEKLPLAVITNGNAEPARFNLHRYFQFILRAGPDGRAKPWEDMYQQATQRLGVAAENILHVGDDLLADVAGSLRYGMQACWINPYGAISAQNREQNSRPHLEITQLASLLDVL